MGTNSFVELGKQTVKVDREDSECEKKTRGISAYSVR